MADTPSPVADKDYSRYLAEIDLYAQKSQKFRERGDKIIRRYLDERSDASKHSSKFNVLWSNTEPFLPSCYAKTPVPIVERRFKDKDPVARWASEVVERELAYFMDCGQFSATMEQCVLDKLLPGRGTAWIRYVPKLRPMQVDGNDPQGSDAGPDGEKPVDRPPPEEVYDEEVVVDYVHWNDFGHNVCRTWDEVWMVWREVFLDRAELARRFGRTEGKTIPLDWSPSGSGDRTDEPVPDSTKKARIYEIWDKRRGQAVWLSRGVDHCLDIIDDPLSLPGFFPTPRPMFATLANKSMLPVAYYTEYQDQAIELDNLTGRIAAITKALKVAGVYDVSAEGIQRLLNEGTENMLVPVERFQALKDKGGIAGTFELWPLGEIADSLMTLYQARDQVKNDLYEISGMPDIIRGASDPQETATAQRIKGSFGSMRLRKMQDDVQRFCRDVLVLMGNVISNQFSWETHRAISGVQLLSEKEKAGYLAALQQWQAQQQPPPPQPGQPPAPPQPHGKPPIPADKIELLNEPTWEQVEALLKNESARGFRVEIETDSTIGADDEIEKKQRMEFLQTAQGLITQAMTAGENTPELVPMTIEMVMFGLRSFKSARTLEGAIEQTLDALKEKAKSGDQKPDPEQQKLQAQTQADQAKLQGQMQLEQMKQQGEQQSTQMKIQADAALAQRNAELQNQLEASKQRFQAEQAQQETQLEAQRNEAERNNLMMIEQFKVQKQMELEQFKAQVERDKAIAIAEINAAAKVEAARVQGVKQDQGAAEFVQGANDAAV